MLLLSVFLLHSTYKLFPFLQKCFFVFIWKAGRDLSSTTSVPKCSQQPDLGHADAWAQNPTQSSHKVTRDLTPWVTITCCISGYTAVERADQKQNILGSNRQPVVGYCNLITLPNVYPLSIIPYIEKPNVNLLRTYKKGIMDLQKLNNSFLITQIWVIRLTITIEFFSGYTCLFVPNAA